MANNCLILVILLVIIIVILLIYFLCFNNMSTVKDSFDLGDGHDHNYNTLLTVIITSSYVKSHPETTLLDKVINSLNLINLPKNTKIILAHDAIPVNKHNDIRGTKGYKRSGTIIRDPKNITFEAIKSNYIKYLLKIKTI